MKHLREALERSTPHGDEPRFPVAWPAGEREVLVRLSQGEGSPRAAVDFRLAKPLLQCADGQFEEAEREILRVLGEGMDACEKDPNALISFMGALFIVQRLDLVVALFKDKFEFATSFDIRFKEDGKRIGLVSWDVLPDGRHQFTYDAALLRTVNPRHRILQLYWEFPVISKYSFYDEMEEGTVTLNFNDRGITPGLAFCDSRPDYFLIPDCVYVPTEGYKYARKILKEKQRPWSERKPMAFWRGSTTGTKYSEAEWRTLERVRLCDLAARHGRTGLFDVGFSSIAQFRDPAIIKEIEDTGFVKGFYPWQDWGDYKYQIDIDGNSSAWSNLFQRFLTGSPVLKVTSPRGLRQWYYDELLPWDNYVPIAPDMSDLLDKIRWLEKNQATAEAIGRSGFELAEKLSYERELERACPVIRAAFRYFRDH